MSLQLGYARLSATVQDATQLDALNTAGCVRIFQDQTSGGGRPELAHLLDVARAGDTVVVWRLDRLASSVRHLLATLTEPETGSTLDRCARGGTPRRQWAGSCGSC